MRFFIKASKIDKLLMKSSIAPAPEVRSNSENGKGHQQPGDKYSKMLHAGVHSEAIRHCMARDGIAEEKIDALLAQAGKTGLGASAVATSRTEKPSLLRDSEHLQKIRQHSASVTETDGVEEVPSTDSFSPEFQYDYAYDAVATSSTSLAVLKIVVDGRTSICCVGAFLGATDGKDELLEALDRFFSLLKSASSF